MNKHEEFILPNYWYLKITNENKEFIQNWRKLVFNLDDDINNWSYITSTGRGGGHVGVVGVTGLENSQFIAYVYNPLFNTQPLIKEDYSYLIPFIQNLNNHEELFT